MGYIFEAITLITEGANPIEIEHAARQIGMPTPPLALLDEIGIDIAWHIIQENHKDPESPPLAKAAIELINELYSHTRLGRKTQQGFYNYQPEKHLWPGILHKYPAKEHLFEDLKKRLLNIQVTMAHTIHQQGLIKKEDANVGAILGLGFCPWSGGPMFVSPETS
jgi:3-hydroxyacyl-CoA dehydrogenase / enoyl-CoA hydratase / 3-hydroxybutyryl-CoA epimerase